QPQTRGLAATGRSHQGDHLFVGHGQIDAVEGRKGFAVPFEVPVHVFEHDGTHARPRLRRTNASTCRKATSISSPTNPMASMPAMTVGGEMLLWPWTIM